MLFSRFLGFPLSLSRFPFECRGSCLLAFCLPVMIPAVARLLLFLELLQVFPFNGSYHGVLVPVVTQLPVVLAVLIDETHLRLTEYGQEVLILAYTGRPGTGLEGHGHPALRQGAVDCPAGQYHQLQLQQGMFEVLFCGRAMVRSRIRQLKGSEQQALLSLQHSSI